MSMIAALLVLADARPVTAEQALAALRAATVIDTCRAPTGDEIVVCGRRGNPYALPLYEPVVGDDGVSGRERENMTDSMMDVLPCRERAEVCLTPVPIIRVPFGRGRKSAPVVGPD